ncbi:hypothetical protein GGI43DRAFT_388855 [Trichoderma evansii]
MEKKTTLISYYRENGSIPHDVQSNPRVVLACALGDITGDNIQAVQEILKRSKAKFLRDVAFYLGKNEVDDLARYINQSSGPKVDGCDIRNALFQMEPAAVVQRMIEMDTINLGPEIRRGVIKFLDKNKAFNFRTTSILATNASETLDEVSGKKNTFKSLATIQRVLLLVSQPDFLPPLLNAGITSAHDVAQISRSRFIELLDSRIEATFAGEIYDQAVDTVLRNQSALVQMHSFVKGTGLADIDGASTVAHRMATCQKQAAANNYNINLEDLFGGMDSYDCDDCLSVFSPANYYVELLQFLRNNTVDPSVNEKGEPLFPNTFDHNYKNTALNVLLQRRPDLQHIQLTCENSNTLIPYIDLANEIMESFVIHQQEHPIHWTTDAEFEVDTFNVEYEQTSNELVAEPHHICYAAYQVLAGDEYPLGSPPFHQPLAAMRSYLQFLNTSRIELMETFVHTPQWPVTDTEEDAKWKEIHTTARKRAISAEYLNITPEEYVVITEESFLVKSYYEIIYPGDMTKDQYPSYSLRPVHKHWGYDSESEMLSADDETKVGLRYLKKQFLPRAGVTYSDVIDLLDSSYVNGVYNIDQAQHAIPALRSNYSLLKSWVDGSSTNMDSKYRFVVDWLFANQAGLPGSQNLTAPFPLVPSRALSRDACTQFVHNWFERLGNLTVLKIGEVASKFEKFDAPNPLQPILPFEGIIWNLLDQTTLPDSSGYFSVTHKVLETFGYLNIDGSITKSKDKLEDKLGFIACNSVAYNCTGQSLLYPDEDGSVYLIGEPVDTANPEERNGRCLALIHPSDNILRHWPKLGSKVGEVVKWENVLYPHSLANPCNLDSLRIVHLDGSELTVHEWNNMQRFIRLSLRTGFSIKDMDKAITGLSPSPLRGSSNAQQLTITPDMLQQIAILKQLQDVTKATLLDLLTFFTEIDTAGPNSLYRRLFLNRNITDLDNVFVPDDVGQVLLTGAKISDHLPVILFALHLTQTQLNAILVDAALVRADLTLPNISLIYRYVLLAEMLHVQPHELVQIIQFFNFSIKKATPIKIMDLIRDFGRTTESLNFPQLAYMVHGNDPEGSMSLSKLQIAKTLTTILDGLANIESELSVLDITSTTNAVKKVFCRLYPVETSEKITSFLDGTIQSGKQADEFFTSHIALILENEESARQTVLQEDTKDLAKDESAWSLKHMISRLRRNLREKFVIGTMANAVGLESTEMVTFLLANVLKATGLNGVTVSTLEGLLELEKESSHSAQDFKGFLLVPETDVYSFVRFGMDKPRDLLVNGTRLPFFQQPESNGVWLTGAIKLEGSHLHEFEVLGLQILDLQWSTPQKVLTSIPMRSFISRLAYLTMQTAIQKISKASMCISNLCLSVEEVKYFHTTSGKTNFKLDLNDPTIEGLKNVQGYCKLRTSETPGVFNLVAFFKWVESASSSSPEVLEIAQQISKATQWDVEDVKRTIGTDGLALVHIADFSNETPLLRIQTTLEVARKVGVNVSKLFKWAISVAKFDEMRRISNEIRTLIKSRYSFAQWEQISKQLHDKLRLMQRDALVAHLLVHPCLKPYGIVDEDSLFEFFLIDVKMGAALKTSRIKQAISTVQHFIQRCILGLEEKRYPTVSKHCIDQKRWKWMSKQALWTANRKVFVYPESYIEPTLRDDKSDLYEIMESELLQKEISAVTIQNSLKDYLFELGKRAGIVVQGIFEDKSQRPHVVHLKVPIDIPTYTADEIPIADGKKLLPETGGYVIPIVFGKRIFIFFGIMLPHVISNPSSSAVRIPTVERSIGKHPPNLEVPDGSAPISLPMPTTHKTWQIKLGWTELQNGAWSPKQVSRDSIFDQPVSDVVPCLDKYLFIPHVNPNFVQIEVVNPDLKVIGGFDFHGLDVFRADIPLRTFPGELRTSFHFLGTPRSPFPTSFGVAAGHMFIYSLQDLNNMQRLRTGPYMHYMPSSDSRFEPGSSSFSHKFLNVLLDQVTETDSLNLFFQSLQKLYLEKRQPFGDFLQLVPNERGEPYSLYLWEMGFHAPMQLADALLKTQKFEAALECCHYVFNPYAAGDSAWKWGPFARVRTEDALLALFSSLKPQTPDYLGVIGKWRDTPFAPHVVARNRPLAYMKWTVMKYLEILIAYGDWYCRQGSLEAFPHALQLYVLAKHIAGPTPQRISKTEKPKPQTYLSLLEKWDAFSNASANMELAFPLNHAPSPMQAHRKSNSAANLIRFSTTTYFCIPDNAQIRHLRELIDLRIHNIREKSISSPLWDLTADPAVLISSATQGIHPAGLLNDLHDPMPNYRFVYILQKAIELCDELKAASRFFLNIRERKDAEALSLMRCRQELAANSRILDIRNLQLKESKLSLEAIRESRNVPLSRYRYYSSLAGRPGLSIEESDLEYKEIEMEIPAPNMTGDLTLTREEKLDLEEAKRAKDACDVATGEDIIAGVLSHLPVVEINGQPLGVGSSFAVDVSQAFQIQARVFRARADTHSYNSSTAIKRAGYIKQHQDRVYQANSAGYELM